jgi:hypothetical protein
MTDDERSAFIMEHRMGFPPSETGPFVTALRAKVREQVAEGLTNRSGGTWATDEIWHQHEERARCILEMEWSIDRGHYHQTEVFDCYPINRRFNTRTMRWHYEFRPDRIMPWVRDQIRLVGYHWRKWRDRKLVNPYSKTSRS